jgi:hypothetical protein
VTCKSSVRFKGFTPALLRMLRALHAVAPACVITSANDSTHSPTSRHYTNEALDIRTKDLPTEQAKRDLVAALRRELGSAFTVLYEDPGGANQHIHIQPKRGTVYSGPA